MSQKELLYIEDIYNHELLIIHILSKTMEECADEKYCALLEKQLDEHENRNKKILKLLEANCNG